jgi:hypothetical protein
VLRQELQPAPHGPVLGHGQPELDLAGRGLAADRDELLEAGEITERGARQVRDDHRGTGSHGRAQGRVGRVGTVRGQVAVELDLRRELNHGRRIQVAHAGPLPLLTNPGCQPAPGRETKRANSWAAD